MGLKKLVSSGSRATTLFLAVGVGLLYLLISLAWIILSDYFAMEAASSREELVLIQQYKGIGFVVAMTVLITWLVYKVHHHGAVLQRALLYMQTDPVTGLANRAVAEEFLETRLERTDTKQRTCGVLLFDIRGLSRVNLSVGRRGGDMLLREVSSRINSFLRRTDLAARLESDRFLIVLGSLSRNNEILTIGRRIQVAFEQPISIDDIEIHVDLRGGAAVAPKDGRTVFELLDAAERALYRSKLSSNGLSMANRDDLLDNSGYLEREAQLRRAIREHQFTIALQPQLDLNTFEVIGAEVLARWDCPGRGEVPPGEFIPLAESLGVVQEITEQIMLLAGECAVNWQSKGLPPLRLCVNLSGLDLKTGRILELIEASVEHSRFPPHLLTLEITESWLMEDHNLALGLIHRLRAMGPRIAIDDFGTGYSALSQLIDFPFDYIKFDRSFISAVDQLPRKAQVLMAIQRMASTLGAQTIAEGVETTGELLLLEELGMDQAQGFLFSRPVTLEQFESRFLTCSRPPFEDLKAEVEQQRANHKDQITRIGGR
ncbi:MAG: EAL domain-containing protein [Gammaproteobacteria bacterium]|nr:EAL domain-containing protein [Gammaproteobacteria bacterium]